MTTTRWIVDMVGTDDTMPDDGPGNKDPQQFLMPARPRPNTLSHSASPQTISREEIGRVRITELCD